MFPTLSEAVTGERITVGPAVLQQVDGADRARAAFPHRRGAAHRLAQAPRPPTCVTSFSGPLSAAAVTSGVCLAVGLGEAPAAVICFGFCAFTTATITQEFARGVSIRKRNTGQDAVSALMGMVIRGKRRYGGYIVHVGIVLMFLGFAGTAYKKETDVKLVPGRLRPRWASTRSASIASPTRRIARRRW